MIVLRRSLSVRGTIGRGKTDRQILVGKAYFRRRFGIENSTAYNFDSFGHSRGLVQILAVYNQEKVELDVADERLCQLLLEGYVMAAIATQVIQPRKWMIPSRGDCGHNSAESVRQAQSV